MWHSGPAARLAQLVPGCNASVAHTFNTSYAAEQTELRQAAEKAEVEQKSRPEALLASALGELASLDLSKAGLKDDL